MERISTVIITRNEEERITDCLRSVRPFSDEILVLDSLSTDRTRLLAKKHGAKVLTQKFLGHVRQKDLAVRKALHDRIFAIDADEQVSPELQSALLKLKMNGFRHDAYRISRRNFYLTDWLLHGGWYPDRKIRLFDRKKACWAGEDPHDFVRPAPSARVASLRGDLLHYTYPDLDSHLGQIGRFSTIAALAKSRKSARPVFWKMLLGPGFTFFKAYWLRLGFLDGLRGLTAARLSALSDFMKYAKLWELRLREKERKRRR